MFSNSIPADGESKGKASVVTADFIVGPYPGCRPTRWFLGLGRKLKVAEDARYRKCGLEEEWLFHIYTLC